jgi:hypothetical protein
MSEHQHTTAQRLALGVRLVAVCAWLLGSIGLGAAPAPRVATAPPPVPTAHISRAVAPTPPAQTNGFVTLAWTPGEPAANTVVSNSTLGRAYAVGNVAKVTLGRQRAGTNQYQVFITTTNLSSGKVATNQVIAQASGRAAVLAVPDRASLSFAPYVFRAVWPGPSGTLQRSPNLDIWTDVGPIAAGGQIFVTNASPQMFYRVHLN